MNDIYEILWNIDKEHNGCSVSKRKDEVSWVDDDADILLDEQVKTSGKRAVDLAVRPLFCKVKEEVFERPTYKAFIKLLNNYIVNYRVDEEISIEEREEIDAFMAVVMETEVMKRAKKYIEEILGRNLRDGELEKVMDKLWFELFTNYYKGRSTHHCSGFEHVFVGEGKYQRRSDSYEVRGEISGYHSWVKFYIDEHIRQVVDYRGYNYRLNGNDGPNNANVVTLQMMWTHLDINGDIQAQLFKKIGGFFVGTSPECEIAMGTVAYYESIQGKFTGDRRRVSIHDEDYNLVLYRNIRESGSRGNHIRSFYPEYKGKEDGDQQGSGQIVVVPVGQTVKNSGPVVITEALINPHGEDEGKEWVDLKNIGKDPIDLSKWELRDKSSRPQQLSGTLDPDVVQRVAITRATPHSMMLGNGGGAIQLIDGFGETISYVTYTKAASGLQYEFPIT